MTQLLQDLKIAVAAENGEQMPAAALLAKQLGLALVSLPAMPGTSYILLLTGRRLELHRNLPGSPGPLFVDFVAGTIAYRRRHGGGRRQPLARAVGLKGGVTPSVIDATAGLGRDGFILAHLGCPVTLVERSPIIGALLEDGLKRAATACDTRPVCDRMSLTIGDSIHFMELLSRSAKPDVVYLDPMYPHRQKSALVKKEMRYLREIVGDDPDASLLLQAAFHCAGRRVVVKRPRLAAAIDGRPPDMSITGKNHRYDVYLNS